MRLTTFHSQFRAIGVNYNQVVKHLKATFTEKMALAMLYKLEKATIELVSSYIYPTIFPIFVPTLTAAGGYLV
ncbi:hypothetical protein FACS189432_04550 [Bacteroidia bacterium]|nr:hypothetical protein FACS189426_04860 [Bacteroidia bacterium]GHT27674.1 hypothetical protein FACS189432_04550 [Bacteroidia bacterium]